jgi:tetratricopeptide (TPR) repeat protein
MTLADSGRREEALAYNNTAVELALKSGDAFLQAAAYDSLGFFLYKHLHQTGESVAALQRAYELYSSIQSPKRATPKFLIDKQLSAK